MLNIFRIIIGGTMLFGSSVLHLPSHAGALSGTITHVETGER